MSALTREQARELVAEAKRARAELAAIGERKQEFVVRNAAGTTPVDTQRIAVEIAAHWNRIRPDGPWWIEARTAGEWRRVTEAGGDRG